MGITYASDLPPAAELLVIGGGVVGAATAFHAAGAGLSPVVVERRDSPASLTTAAAAGGFRLQLETEEAYRLVRGSVELFASFAEATGQDEHGPDLRPQGYLWLTTEERMAAEQRRLAEAQRTWGLDDVEVLEEDEVRRRFPFVAPEAVQARFRAADGLLDPVGLALGLLAGSGAPVVTGCEVTGFLFSGGRVVGVRTSRGEVASDAVVIAAGPLSGPLVARAGMDLPLSAVRRQRVVVPDVPEVPPEAPMTIDEDTGAHWRPAAGGASLMFADPGEPPGPPSDPVPVDEGFARRLLDPRSPVSVARVAPFWGPVGERLLAGGGRGWSVRAGQYTMTPDHRPLIGRTGVEGLFVNTGYSGRGVMLGPSASRLLVDELLGKAEGATNPFRPDRSFAEPEGGVL